MTNRAKLQAARAFGIAPSRFLDDPAALIAFHRQTFGGYTMMADDDQGGTGDGGDQGDGGQQGASGGNQGGSDKGFPEGTPVAEMTVEQRLAYWQHQSRKHEERATAYRSAAGGKTADEIKAELAAAEQLRLEKLSADERAVEDAKRTAREEAAREYGPKTVRAAFELLLGDMPEQERTAEIDLLDLSKFLTESGDVDTAKVRNFASKIAPAAKDKGNRQHDYGAGNRQSTPAAGSVAAVMAARRAAREAEAARK